MGEPILTGVFFTSIVLSGKKIVIMIRYHFRSVFYI